MARHDISVNCCTCKGRKCRDSLGGRNRCHEYRRSREVLRSTRKDTDHMRRLGRTPAFLDDLIRQQPGQMLLDGDRRRLQCGPSDRVHGESDQGCSAQGLPCHGQSEGPSLQARHGVAREAQGQDRGVLPSKLQSGTESGRAVECRSETCHHDKRSQAHQTGTAQEDRGTYDDGCIDARARKIILQGQACALCGRFTIIHCRSNKDEIE